MGNCRHEGFSLVDCSFVFILQEFSVATVSDKEHAGEDRRVSQNKMRAIRTPAAKPRKTPTTTAFFPSEYIFVMPPPATAVKSGKIKAAKARHTKETPLGAPRKAGSTVPPLLQLAQPPPQL
jgi:hypothetical protein